MTRKGTYKGSKNKFERHRLNIEDSRTNKLRKKNITGFHQQMEIGWAKDESRGRGAVFLEGSRWFEAGL